MRIGIVAAWEPELRHLYARVPVSRTVKTAVWTFDTHLYGDLEIISVVSGVGKVKGATFWTICCLSALERYRVLREE